MRKTFLVTLALAMLTGWLSCGGHETPSGQTAGDDTLYREPHRPQFHFSPPAKWANDPNGMYYHDGEYHLFYQHYPAESVWGPMHWAHAVSRDLVHWENLPIALYPDTLGYIFSGSAVVDRGNTSGFGAAGQVPIVAMFTYHDDAAAKAGSESFQSQALAYSLDNGRTWTKYGGNPVLPNPGGVRDIRDPKVVWDAERNQWVVALAVGDHAAFYGSPDLTHWRPLSEFGRTLGAHGGVWECPDLFPMQVAESGETKWVLVININPGHPNGGSGTQYFVGDFDGRDFRPDPDFIPFVEGGRAVWLDYGKDNYAGVTWSDAPEGRRILIGWMSNWEYANQVPTTAWRNAMTVPRELTLRRTPAGYRLFSAPVAALSTLVSERRTVALSDSPAARIPLDSTGGTPLLLDISASWELGAVRRGSVGLELTNQAGERYRVGYDLERNRFFSDRTQAGDHTFSDTFAPVASTAPRSTTDRLLTMRILVDAASAELFADGGATCMTEIFFPRSPFTAAQLFAEGTAEVRLSDGEYRKLKTIW